MYTYIYMYVYIYMYIYIYMYTHVCEKNKASHDEIEYAS